MKLTGKKLSTVTLLLLTFSIAAPSSIFAAPSVASDKSKPLEVCRDADGNTKTGALDVLLLLDNSKSLNSTKKGRRPSDGNNERYGAITEMLKSLSEVVSGDDGRKGVSINFGVVSFGYGAKNEIDLTPLTSLNATTLGEEVEEKVPGKVGSQAQQTNYIAALDAALKTLNSRPSENCKFLVWFTDGQFESSETREPEEQSKQANTLRRRVCEGKESFSARFIESRINTFVLILKPTVTDKRLAVSYGAMQAITGATELPSAVKAGIGKSADMCGTLASTPHLGDILIAGDAKEIARKIPTIANLLTKWRPVTKCPATSSVDGLAAMPAARHIQGLSFTAYEKGRELSELAESEVINNSGKSQSFDTYFVKDSGSRFEQKYRLNKRAEEELDQGWSINIKNGPSGWCVQMLEHDFEVAFQGSPASPVATSSVGALTSEDLRNLTYFDKKNRDGSLSLREALSFTGEVGASLIIDPTNIIYAEPIEIRVKQQNSPYISCASFDLKEEGNIPSPARISAVCGIDTKDTALQNVRIRLVSDPVLESEQCKAALGLVQKPAGATLGEKDALQTELIHVRGSSQIFVVLEAQGSSADCSSKDAVVRFAFDVPKVGEKVIERQVNIDVQWKTKPSALLVWLLVALALLVAALLNLLLLREIKKYTSKMSRSGLFAFEVPISLLRQRTGQLTVTTKDGSALSSVVFNVDEQIAVRVENDGRSAKLTGGTRSSLLVKLPSLFRPFAPPLLVLDSKTSVYYSPNFEEGSGLSPLVRQAVIVHSPVRDGDSCSATATLLIPNTGPGKDQIIRDLLGSKLVNAIKPIANDSDWFEGFGKQPQRDESTVSDSTSSAVIPPDVGGLAPPKPGGM